MSSKKSMNVNIKDNTKKVERKKIVKVDKVKVISSTSEIQTVDIKQSDLGKSVNNNEKVDVKSNNTENVDIKGSNTSNSHEFGLLAERSSGNTSNSHEFGLLAERSSGNTSNSHEFGLLAERSSGNTDKDDVKCSNTSNSHEFGRLAERSSGNTDKVDVKDSNTDKVDVKDNNTDKVDVKDSNTEKFDVKSSNIEKVDAKSSNTEKVDVKCSEKIEKEINHPISDDTMDYLDSCVDKLNETKNIGEKISLHSKLNDTIGDLEKEIDNMVDIIDNIDIDTINNDINTNQVETDKSSIDDNIVNLELMLQNMKEEEILQTKIIHLQRITDMVKNCRKQCNVSQIKIHKCN